MTYLQQILASLIAWIILGVATGLALRARRAAKQKGKRP